jgi:hypothetical protein
MPPIRLRNAATTPTSTAATTEPSMSQPANPPSAPMTPEPMKRPKIARTMPPTTKISMKPMMSRPSNPPPPTLCAGRAARGGGSGSPSTTEIMRLTPASMPP